MLNAMTMIPALLQGDEAAGALVALFGGVMMLFSFAVALIVIIGCWKVFVKAGQPGWAILIPFYNIYILLQIAGKPGWWLLLFFIPVVNIVIAALVAIDIAKAFGQSAIFGIVLLFLLAGVGYLILGFGNYQYKGPPTSPTL